MTVQPDRQTALQWARKADGDIEIANRALIPEDGAPYDLICFHAQQAVEKYLKAMLIVHGILFGRTHDLAELFSKIPAGTLPEIDRHEIISLTPYAIAVRYPGDADELTRQDALQSLVIAKKLREQTMRILNHAS